ncbi:MAG: alpha/beta hydrolase, partial [Planctomycetota bacterium]|nr:alpha/beta hydrolase [Planctomycetota bacterium]
MRNSNPSVVGIISATAFILLGVINSTSPGQSDSNSDERIKRLLKRSPEADANKDGVLTLKEAQAFLKEQRAKRPDRNRARPQPTHADLKYGEHKRHAIDLYLIESERPTPLVIYIHGGGFVGGDKRSVSAGLIQSMHKAGISVAAIHYRFIKEHPFPAPFVDSARAVQFLRHNADRYNLDIKRFAATGGSAGAGISLWLATRDDMADPKSDDPVGRQSTRISCASVGGAQVSYDPRFWREIGLAKGLQHSSFSLMYGVPSDDPFEDPKKIAIAEACAPIEHLTKDDPPVYFQYGVPDELNDRTSLGAVVHHPRHGQLFKKKMDKLGLECHVQYPGGPQAKLSSAEFLIKHLTQTTAASPRPTNS